MEVMKENEDWGEPYFEDSSSEALSFETLLSASSGGSIYLDDPAGPNASTWSFASDPVDDEEKLMPTPSRESSHTDLRSMSAAPTSPPVSEAGSATSSVKSASSNIKAKLRSIASATTRAVKPGAAKVAEKVKRLSKPIHAFFGPKISPEELLERNRAERIAEESFREELRAREETEKARRQVAARKANNERKRKSRERKRQREIEDGIRLPDGKRRRVSTVASLPLHREEAFTQFTTDNDIELEEARRY